MDRNKIIWMLTRAAILGISILIFTPLVTPKGVITPELFGLPYTLWMGIAVYISFVTLIFIGISVHAKIFREQNND